MQKSTNISQYPIHSKIEFVKKQNLHDYFTDCNSFNAYMEHKQDEEKSWSGLLLIVDEYISAIVQLFIDEDLIVPALAAAKCFLTSERNRNTDETWNTS